MTAIASALPLLQGLWVNLWTWGLMRFATGFCLAVLYVVIESWLNEQSTNESRGTVFSVYIVIVMTMLAAGQQMLLLGNPGDLVLFAVASVLVSLAAVPVLVSVGIEPQPVEDSTFNLRQLYKNSPSGMVGSLTSGLTNGSFWALAPVFTANITQDVSMAAWFMTAGVLGGAVGQWPLGWWSDKVDRRTVVLVACLICVLTGASLWMYAPQLSKFSILALGFLWGAFAFPVYSISVAQANDRADPGTFVMISSGLLLMYGLGAIIGPFLSSAVMTVIGSGSLFLFAAFAHFLLALFTLLRRNKQQEPPEEDHTEFSEALASALTASHIYQDEIESEHLRTSPGQSDNSSNSSHSKCPK
jgi:MFS family permease